MAFMEPRALETGIAEMPSRLYGALTYSAHRLDNLPTTSTTRRFIPLHNLAFFHRRPLLFPHPITVPRPLYDHPPQCDEMIAKRYIPLDVFGVENEKRFDQKNRNLLSGEEMDSNRVRLWLVDDNSDRQQLCELSVTVEYPDDDHEPLSCEIEESPICNVVDLNADCLELRAYDRGTATGRVFARCSNRLLLWNGNSVADVYPYPTQFMERIAHMDEVAIIDTAGLIFMGPVDGGGFSRIKCSDSAVSVSSTDNPSCLLVATNTNVYTADSRSPRALADLFGFQTENHRFVEPLIGEPENLITRRQRIWHLNSVRADTELFVVTASQRMFVVDRRIPNLPLFHMNHFQIKAGEYCAMTEPFHHDQLNLDVYQYFLLSRVCNPQLLHWSVGWNGGESVCSSMGPSCVVEEPQHILQLSRSQPQFGHIDAEHIPRLPSVTRAFHYQHLSNGEHRGLLFRQMNNGQLWYDSMHFAKPKPLCPNEGTEMRPALVRRSIQEVNEFFAQNEDRNLVDLDDELNVDPKSIKRKVDAERLKKRLRKPPQSSKQRKTPDSAEEYEVELDDITVLLARFQSPPMENVDEFRPKTAADIQENQLFSQTVLQCAENSHKYMDELIANMRLLEAHDNDTEPQPSTSQVRIDEDEPLDDDYSRGSL